MTDRDRRIKSLCINAVTAALYAALTVMTAPISFGAVQLRIAEALCVLPYFMPRTVWGLFVGCILANLFSGNVFDLIFGSLATLFAALCIARLGRRKTPVNAWLACLMPVLFNAVIVGAVITYAYEGREPASAPKLFALNALWVALGETAVMSALGRPLIALIEKRR